MSISQFGDGTGSGKWARQVHDMLDEMLKRDYVQYRDTDCFQPATNVYESRDHYYICVELAGLDAAQIDVRWTAQRAIQITGERAAPRPTGYDGVLSMHAMEIDNGRFRRTIDLPEPVVTQEIHAEIDKGFLWILVPRIQKS